MEYLNEYCWKGTVKTFLSLDCETWLQKMKQRYHRVTPHRLTPQQERAWENSFNVLHDAFETLGDDYKKLNLVFEYCLPMYPPRRSGVISSQHVIRADCIVVSDKSVVVLEFKDRSDVRKEHGFTARRYRNRLHKYHDQSKGKRKWAVLIPTLSENVHEVILQRITACSPNKLADELRVQFGDKPKTVKVFQDWIASSYSVHEKTRSKGQLKAEEESSEKQ